MAENNSSAPLKTSEGAYPALPAPDTHCHDEDTGRDVWSYSAEQMRFYAAQAVAAQAAPAAVAVTEAQIDAILDEPGGMIFHVSDQRHKQHLFARRVLALATPALPATEDSSAGDLAEPNQILKCRDLNDQDMDLIVSWMAQQEKGDIGFTVFAEKIIQAFARTTQAEVQAEPVADCYSDDDGDTWRDLPSDIDFVQGRKLGEEFELQASIRSWSETFRVSKVPDETSDDYEVEPVAVRTAPQAQPAFQQRVQPWMMECFGAEHAADRKKRNQHFLEEALELVQSTGWTQSEAHQLVDYVYGRPWGEPAQEVGGVMVTLAALCLANGLDMHQAGESELARIWSNVDSIRARQTAKPSFSPLPQAQPADALDAETIKKAARYDWIREQGMLSDGSRHPHSWRCVALLADMGGERADAAIDAAMAAAQEGGKA